MHFGYKVTKYFKHYIIQFVQKSKFPNKALVSRTDYVLSNPFSTVVQGKKASSTNTGISCTKLFTISEKGKYYNNCF